MSPRLARVARVAAVTVTHVTVAMSADEVKAIVLAKMDELKAIVSAKAIELGLDAKAIELKAKLDETMETDIGVVLVCGITLLVILSTFSLFSSKPRSKPPHMIYFPVAGRGELAKLIAAAGGLELKVTIDPEERKKYVKAEFGSPSGLPLLEHNGLKISQSAAIETYLASIAPKFAALTPAQVATDRMFAHIKEDVLLGCAKIVFGGALVKDGPTEVPKHVDKWFPVVESLVPAKGFVLGLEYPTVADLAVLNMGKGYMPFGATYKHGKYDYTLKYPKIAGLVERTAAAPGVKEYLATSTSMSLTLLDVDKKK